MPGIKKVILSSTLFVMLIIREPCHVWAESKKSQRNPSRQVVFHSAQANFKVNTELDGITAASSEVNLILLEGFDALNGVVGEAVDIKFFSKEFIAGAFTVSGNLPPGLRLSPIITEFGVGTISGTPTQDGLFLVNLTGWENANAQGPSSQPLTLLFEIISRGPKIVQQPGNTIVDWGSPAIMSVVVEDSGNASYKWFKDLVELEGQKTSSLQFDHAGYALNGTYRVEVVGPEGSSFSKDAFFFVRTSPYQRWLEEGQADPFASELSENADADFDGFANIVEYALGTEMLDTSSQPRIYITTIQENGQLIGSFQHSIPTNSNPYTLVLEGSENLSSTGWKKLEVQGVDEGNLRRYQWFMDGTKFVRLTLEN
ncbi:MAG: immunoglobulin domain-containing protein [Verrucomicrobia bacterium]|nr:immunoglobulin domain-containing protein [Verrucomicrobiota bacterium]